MSAQEAFLASPQYLPIMHRKPRYYIAPCIFCIAHFPYCKSVVLVKNNINCYIYILFIILQPNFYSYAGK